MKRPSEALERCARPHLNQFQGNMVMAAAQHIRTNLSDETPPNIDAAVRELVGAAHAASLVLERASQMGGERNMTLECAMSWLSYKLTSSAEALEAIYDRREPSWFCQGDADEISEALRKAAALGAADRTLRSVKA